MASTTTTDQKSKITLHWLDKSRSQRIVWLLEELGVDYDLKVYKRQPDLFAPPDLKKIHPLGKSPVIEVHGEDLESLVIAESGAIIEYILDHFGQSMIPKRYKDGKDGRLGGETEEWLRYRHYMHYTEGTLMPLLAVWVIMSQLKGPSVPFFIRPISRAIAGKVEDAFLVPNIHRNLEFLESQLDSSPQGGKYFAGRELTGADILLAFPLEAGKGRIGLTKEKYPKVFEWTLMVQQREAYKRSVKKIERVTGEPYVISD